MEKDNWDSDKLGNLCDVVLGRTPSRSKKQYWGIGTSWTSIRDMSQRIITETKEQITEEGAIASRSRLIPKGTLLMSFKLSVGKLAFAAKDLYTNEAIAALPIKDLKRIDQNYLYYLLQNIPLIGGNQAVMGQTLNKSSLENLKLFFPKNIKDQKHIAQVLGDCEELIALRRESIALLDELVKSTFLEMFGDPTQQDYNREYTNLGNLGDWKSGGTPSRKKAENFGGEIPWITSGELNEVYISEAKEHITETGLIGSNAKLLQSGTLLLGMYDTAALKSSICTKEMTCNQAIAYSKLDETKCLPEFVYTAIQLGKEYYRSKQRGVRQKNMNLTMIKELEIPFPHIDAQTKFVSIFKEIQISKALFSYHLLELEHFYGRLSQDAFKGELDLSGLKLRDGKELSDLLELENSNNKEPVNTPSYKLDDYMDMEVKLNKVAEGKVAYKKRSDGI